MFLIIYGTITKRGIEVSQQWIDFFACTPNPVILRIPKVKNNNKRSLTVLMKYEIIKITIIFVIDTYKDSKPYLISLIFISS